MNKRETQRKINDHSRLLNKHSSFFGSHIDCIRVNVGNTYAHELKKFRICWDLKTQGIPFMTEAEFDTGGRCDVFDLLNGEIYEVLHSETIEQARAKTQKYPVGLFVHFIQTESDRGKD